MDNKEFYEKAKNKDLIIGGVAAAVGIAAYFIFRKKPTKMERAKKFVEKKVSKYADLAEDKFEDIKAETQSFGDKIMDFVADNRQTIEQVSQILSTLISKKR